MADSIKVDSSEIAKALKLCRHTHDYFLTEVKSGSTWMGTANRILDAVAIKKSWTHPRITGYEIKISRSDFLRDNKFMTYLPLCHVFYMACPKGLIKREELPADVGLIWYNPDSKQTTVKLHPPYRKIEISADMLMYIIFSRLDEERIPFYNQKAAYWRDWLENKSDNRKLGRIVGGALCDRIRELENEVKEAGKFEAGDDREKYKNLMQCLCAAGMYQWERDPAKWLEGQLAKQYPMALDDVERQLSYAINCINAAKREACQKVEEV